MPIIPPTPIDQLPQPPNPADRSNFNSLAYPFTAAMLPLTVQINKAVSDMYNNALEAEAKASEASVSAGEAHNSELAAQAAEALAEGYKNAAATSAGQAGDSEIMATEAAGQATLARDKAQEWATATDVVEGGLKGARGYAQDAAQSAADAASAVQGNFGPAIHAATAKGAPADADELAIADSQASWTLKKLTWGGLKAAIWSAFKAIATGGSAKDTLGLGSAATRDVGTASGNVMGVGAFGIGQSFDLRSTIYTTGAPADLYGNGYVVGFTDGSLLSPPASQQGIYGTLEVKFTYHDNSGMSAYSRTFTTNDRVLIQQAVDDNTWGPWRELISTGNIQSSTGQSTEYPMSQKAVTDALENIDVSGPRPVKDHGAVATAGSQTVVCNVQESDFHIMSMETANTTGTLTIDFANMPDTVGKHFSWHVRLRRGGRKTVAFAQTITWAGGEPVFGSTSNSYDLIMFYKVDSETIRAMVVDAY